MNKAEFAKVLSPIIQTKTYSSNQKLMDAFKNVLKGTTEQNAFYSKLKDGANVQTFAKLVSSNQVNLRGQEDYEPLKSESYWNRPKAEFVYTAKILPEIRNRFPDSYKKVFDGTKVLDAGLGGKPENGKTIWNAVKDAQGSGDENNQKQSQSNETKVDPDKIENAVRNFAKQNNDKKWKLSSEQIPYVSKFITKLLQDM